jgi:hypothetical protein
MTMGEFMKSLNLKHQSIYHLIFLSALSGCGAYDLAVISKFTDETERSGEIICDPLDNEKPISKTNGLVGELRYLTEAPQNPSLLNTKIFEDTGKLVTQNLFLSRMNVPTHEFRSGFMGSNGNAVKDDHGSLLVEWFSLHLQSSIVLGAADQPGRYQFAVISDDGARLDQVLPNGDRLSIVNSDGLNSSRLGCSNQSFEFQESTALPIRYSYFQGPRYYIASVILWRKIPDGESASNETLCGTQGDFAFWDASGTSTNNFNQLTARGWKTLTADNYQLTGVENQCYSSQ